MPISNPIIQGLTVNLVQGSEVTIANSNPTATPTAPKNFWFNVLTSRLYLAIATNSVADWILLGGSTEWVDIENKPDTFPSTWDEVAEKPDTFPSTWDEVAEKPNTFPSTWDQVGNKPNLNPDIAAILSKILVADGQVLTTEENVIFED